MNFFFVYVLFSETDKKLYIGYTADINLRFQQHLNGEVVSTAPRRPLKLIYYEAHLSQKEALKREQYFKSSSGKRTLKIVLNDTLFELGYLGKPREILLLGFLFLGRYAYLKLIFFNSKASLAQLVRALPLGSGINPVAPPSYINPRAFNSKYLLIVFTDKSSGLVNTACTPYCFSFCTICSFSERNFCAIVCR
jgi:putative endonuclease